MGDKLETETLHAQLQTYGIEFTHWFNKNNDARLSIFDVKTFFRSLSVSQRNLLSQVCVIYKVFVIMPATNATSERSIITLCHVKTYLRNTLDQEKLHNLMILHAHKEITDSFDLDAITNEFIVNSERRQKCIWFH